LRDSASLASRIRFPTGTGSNSTCGFELEEFPNFPLYNGSPNWALPAVGAYYRFRDGLSRTLARCS
jgi:hypothetical protein